MPCRRRLWRPGGAGGLRGTRLVAQEVPSMVEPPGPSRRVEPICLEPYPDVLLEGLADTAPGRRRVRDEQFGRTRIAGYTATSSAAPPRRARAPRCARLWHGRGGEEAREQRGLCQGALQRARATLDERLPPGGCERLLHVHRRCPLTMPPEPFEYRGQEAIAAFLRHRAELRGARSLRCPPGPTPSRRSAATYRTRTRRLPAPLD
jgi:hypothetical protein